MSFSSIDGDRFRVTFTKGNGAKRIIVARAGSPVNAIPEDATDYIAGSFGAASEIGSGNYVVYDGTGNSNITISGLTQNTIYFIKIFEYNGSDFMTEYLICFDI